MKDFLKKKDHFLCEIIVINSMILFYLFRTSIPFFKYPFLFLYISFLIYSITKNHYRIASSLKEFVKNYFLIILLAAILIISFFLSNKLYLTIFKDIINAIILISFFYVMTFFLNSKEDYEYFLRIFFVQLVFFSLLISLNVIFIVLNIYHSYDVLTYNNGLYPNPDEVLVKVDNNFAILPAIIGMIISFYYLVKTKKVWYRIFINIFLIIYLFGIFFSSSRRAFIILLLIILIIILLQLFRFNKNERLFKKLAKKSCFFLYNILIFVTISCLIIIFASYNTKNSILEFAGSKNLLETRMSITNIISRYATIVNKTVSIEKLYNILWTPSFNPKDPESTWGTRIHRTIYPLTGKNCEIVPEGAKGYYMDSTCNASPESTYCESYSLVTLLKTKKGDRYKASVYCFVSEDFNGSNVRITLPLVAIENNIVFDKTSDIYDLNSKGVWKKLEIDFQCNTGEVPIYISFIKANVKDFRNLKGHVIFAYPDYQLVGSGDSISQTSYVPLIGINKTNHYSNHRILLSNHMTDSNYILHNNLEYIGEKSITEMSLNLNNNTRLRSIILFPRASYSIFSYHDPIRKRVAKFISEDTTYYPYKTNIIIDTVTNKLFKDRLVRWQFTFQIFCKEYTWLQKLIGYGFNHLNWFGYFFFNNKVKSDWPHNPLLSVLLYSGIIGLLIYILFLYKVIYFYIKYFKQYPLLIMFFMITFFFSFFSADSPFNPPIMGFFTILPFFINYIHKKDKIELN